MDPEPVRAAATSQERHGLARSVLGTCMPTGRRKAAGPAGVETVGQARFEQDTRRALDAQMLWDVPER